MKIAVIPARGGSKRIPRKNIKPFCGKPIIAYSIEAARQSGLFDMIIVSTDDDEIAAVAREYGADTPFIRPKEIADDFTGTNAVVKHAIAWTIANRGAVEHACCIYATAPFVQPSYLQQGYHALLERGKRFAFSVTSFPFPIQRGLYLIDHEGVEPVFPEAMPKRSQDLREAYHDAGQFYWGTAHAYLEDAPLFTEHSFPVILPRHLVQDIDTMEDWRRAELMYQAWALQEEIAR